MCMCVVAGVVGHGTGGEGCRGVVGLGRRSGAYACARRLVTWGPGRSGRGAVRGGGRSGQECWGGAVAMHALGVGADQARKHG